MKFVSISLRSGELAGGMGWNWSQCLREAKWEGWEHEHFPKQNKAKQQGLFQNLKQEKSFSFIPSAR